MAEINNLPNIPLFIPSYNREMQIAISERKIAQIDQKIARHEKNNSIIKELLANNNKRIENNDKLIGAIKESRDILQSSRDTLQESRDITAKLIDCYEKLLEIRRTKNNSNALNMKQVIPLNVSTNDIKSTEVLPPKVIDIKTIRWTATKELGDVIYDQYKDINQTTALNLRSKFFADLNYDSSNKISSDNFDLKEIFNTFFSYLKTERYNYLKNDKDYFNDLQDKLVSLDKSC